MKKYKVFLSDGNGQYDSFDTSKKYLSKECGDIEHLLNADYDMHDKDTEYGELHSIVNISSHDSEKLLTIFQKEVFDVEFSVPESENLVYELTNKEIQFINNFKKITLEDVIYNVTDISYSLDDNIIKVRLEK